MDKLKMHSVDKVQQHIEQIRALFPNCVTETKNDKGETTFAVDFDMLRQELSDVVVEGPKERYQFTWPDKRKSVLAANAPIAKTLRPVRTDEATPTGFDSNGKPYCSSGSVNFDTTENLYIEGDNLDVLKLLQETYLGKVKMIYIDPPYNTGNDFVYEDDFSESAEEYMSRSGDYDEEGNRLVRNLDSNGRFHTDWLNMIYPRLKLAKDLLTDDGVIFISIDENEVNTLKAVCDEVFGAHNFVAELVWSAGRKNDSKHISISHEYILCYFRNAQYIADHKIIWRERKQGLDSIYETYESLSKKYGSNYKSIERDLKTWYKSLPDGHPAKDHAHYNKVDEKGIFFASDISWPGGGGPKYEILHPITGNPVVIPSRGWLTNKETMKQWISEGRVYFGEDETSVPTIKSYLVEHEHGVPYSVFYKDGRASSKRLAALMGGKVFENPKDEEIIKRLIEFSGTGEHDIVLDFFSGSATTAHALFLAEVEKQSHRKFILAQIPETIDPNHATSEKAKKVAKNAIALLDSLGAPHTICEIGKERIRRAGAKIKEENPLTTQNLDVGFRVLKVDSTNMQDVYYNPAAVQQGDLLALADNIKPDRTAEDLLFQIMLDLGILLSSKIEQTTIAGKTVYSVADGYLLACFDSGVTDEVVTEVAKRQPYYFVMRDSSLANDATAANFDQIFQTYSPTTVRKVL